MVPSYLVCIIIYFPAVVVAYVQLILWRSDNDHVIHMRRLGLYIVLRHSKGQKKELQSLSKAHYFYFKINIFSKSITAFVLTRI